MGGIKFEFKGFQKILDNIDKAEKDAERVAKASIEKCADIYQSELMTAAQSANVPRDLTSEIKKEVNGKNGVYTARIGWKLGTYDPKKPSAGYKAMFLNYGNNSNEALRIIRSRTISIFMECLWSPIWEGKGLPR